VVAYDTTQVTSSNRVKIYVNGLQITLSGTYPSQDFQTDFNNTVIHAIGSRTDDGGLPASAANHYLADIYFIDGQALTPSSFTETDATTGQLVAKAYTGSYGTNGFHLEFADNSSNTATTLGKDTSGNGNNWTPNNLSVTAGAGNDSLVDVPTSSGTDTGVGGEVRGNYCTWNPLFSAGTLTNGNLDAAGPNNDWHISRATIGLPASGKYYWEVTVNSSSGIYGIGLATAAAANAASSGINVGTGYYEVAYYTGSNISKVVNGSATQISSTTWSSGDVIMIAHDASNSKTWFGRNGTWYPPTNGGTAGDPAAGTNETLTTAGTVFPSVHTYGTGAVVNANWGARPFAYTAPSGFKALCTANLPAPLVTKPNTVMDVVLYTGTGSSLTLPYASSTPTSIAFTPDLVWIKGRSGATDHALYDAVRDVQKDLASNSTAAETTQSTGLTAFGTNTFTIGSLAKLNTSSATYAAWCWDAGSSTDTNNTAGTITPTGVRANATAGFSIIGYTGTGSNATVGHGLGVTPGLLICKSRTQSGGSNWVVWHSLFTGSEFLRLNTTDSKQTASVVFNSTAPSSTVISLGTDAATNGNGNTHIIYAFAPVVGYSSFGSYTGNGSSDGPFVYTGFRPRWIMIKRTDSTANWRVLDTARDTYNVASAELYPSLSNAEASFSALDILSNGFKVRTSDVNYNASSGTYVWAAFAESPFQYARAR
jgi:hypothetical protein